MSSPQRLDVCRPRPTGEAKMPTPKQVPPDACQSLQSSNRKVPVVN